MESTLFAAVCLLGAALVAALALLLRSINRQIEADAVIRGQERKIAGLRQIVANLKGEA